MNYYKHPAALVGEKASIGSETRIWAYTNVMNGARVGARCNICDGCFIESGAVIGDDCTVKNHVSVWDGVVLEDNVFVGPNACFVNDRFPRSRQHDKWVLEKTVVRKSASLGANSTILCGVTVGEYALVGAGSVVVHDVPAHAVMVGNPARQIGWAGTDGRRLNDQLESASGEKYRLTPRGLEKI